MPKNGHYYFIPVLLVQVLVFIVKYYTLYSVRMPLRTTQEVHQIKVSLGLERPSKQKDREQRAEVMSQVTVGLPAAIKATASSNHEPLNEGPSVAAVRCSTLDQDLSP